MILQALKEYYDRKADLPREGWEFKEIPWVLAIDSDGTPTGLNSTVEGQGKQKQAKRFLVPAAVKKTSGIASNLLWENPEYALGIVLKGKPERVAAQHEAFKQRIADLGEVHDPGLAAVKRFLEIEDKAVCLEQFGDVWTQFLEEGANLTFQLNGEPEVVSERPLVKTAIEAAGGGVGETSFCLVSGKEESTSRLHAAIKGVWGAQPSGANIVSFNSEAFTSYGKKQGDNAPVGETSVFAYTTALNHLLGRESKQRIQVGDTSTVFWAAKPEDAAFEESFASFFSEPPKDNPDCGVQAVESLFRAVQTGALSTGHDHRFYVLGLAPNASRIAIRFWICDTIAGMAGRIAQHFVDTRICHGPKNKDSLSLFRLLVSTAVLGKSENIPPNLGGEVMRAILEGRPYPMTLLQSAVRRIRAEHEVTYPRAAIIKACINRQTQKEDLHVSLDETNKNIGYRLGRLFAVLEKVQADANPGINATIRDRFYGAASGTPVTVFGNLMRLKNHHLAKLSDGLRITRERLITEIMGDINDFPSHLDLADQGRFSIGYYHQVKQFYTKKIDKTQTQESQSHE